jgi:hypothetical protein
MFSTFCRPHQNDDFAGKPVIVFEVTWNDLAGSDSKPVETVLFYTDCLGWASTRRWHDFRLKALATSMLQRRYSWSDARPVCLAAPGNRDLFQSLPIERDSIARQKEKSQWRLQ